MHSMGKTIVELHVMLKLEEKGIPKKAKTPVVLAIREGKIQKDKRKPQGAKCKDKRKNKLAYAPKPKIPPPPKRDNLAKDSICQHYKEVGHWRRNYPSYQVELKKRKNASMASTLGIFTIELYGLRRSKTLKHRALSVYMGNGMRAAVEAIRSFDLILLSGLLIVLDNFHFTPIVTRGVVSISRLVKNCYSHTITNYGISVSKDNVFYFNAIPHDGIYEIDMHNLYPDVSSTFNVSNKRVKYSLDSSYLWHCRLGHINKKRMDKLQHDGILQPSYDESIEKCICSRVCSSYSQYGSNQEVKRTPYEIWRGKAPKLSYLNLWGCEALVKQDTPDKLDPRSIKCIFVGYPKETMGYYFYYPPENKIFVAQNAEFFDNSLIVQEASGSHGPLKMSGSDKGLELIQKVDIQPSENTSEEHNEVVPIKEYEVRDLNEPHNYKAELSDPEFKKWLEAMNMEMQSMKDNRVWVLIDLPPNGRTVRSKWLFNKKTNMDGNVHTFKACLVAKGFTQTYGVDYKETFSPIADIRAIRILLAIAAFYDYEIWQMDVKTTFLNGHLSEDVYMVQPERFMDPKHPNNVYKLQHSIYGLKQASRNLGETAYILGIKIIRDRYKRLIALSQSAYLEKILKKFRMENSKKGYTSIMEKSDYRKSQGAKTPSEVQRTQRVPYASAIGSIMYAVRCTRHDVAFAQNLCSCFQQNPGEIHGTVVKTILKYLKNTKDMVLVYGAKPKAELKVSCYADASFQTDKDDTKSQMGYVFVLNGGAVDWKSAKKSTTAMSSIEAEYIVAAEVSMEAVWMRKFIDGLGDVVSSNKRPMEILCDNEPAIAIVVDPGILKGARHFQRKYHYIREVIQECKIVLKKVHTNDNLVDPFTKPMSFNKHYKHVMAIGIVHASSLM
ncbi:retrotransposon protein, putative, ty1-copia subclass [Tanacetum coccineum]